MNRRPPVMDRRRLLRGLGGVTLGLPMLDVFTPRRGEAAPARRIYSAFVLQANGVVQAWGTEPEKFWPRTVGPLDRTTMETTDADRATSELAEWASKLLMVKGLKFGFPGNGCGHSGGGNQVLTAARVSTMPRGNRSLAMGESVDTRIARELTPDREPFAVYAGRKGGYIDDNFSFRGPLQVRAADNNPWTAYTRMIGLGAGGATDAALAQRIVARRKSLNDLLRTQLKDLLGRADLTPEDRRRMDLHLTSIRDIELSMVKQLPPEMTAQLKAIDGKHRDPLNMQTAIGMQVDLVAFALASDYARTATLQIGDGNDGTKYTLDGVATPSFHQISHRVFSDGGDAPAIPNAIELHHKIDRLHAQAFKRLVARVAAYSTPTAASLLDESFLVWTNSLANGPPHSYDGVPYIIAGSAGGYLKTGQLIDVKKLAGKSVTNNKLFNTFLNAAGVRKSDGSLVDDFGDPSLEKGWLAPLLAA